MRGALNKVLCKAGYKIVKYKKTVPAPHVEVDTHPAVVTNLATVTNFGELYKAPRYTTQIATINERPFVLSDAPSFCPSFNEIFLDEIYKFESATNEPVIIDCGSNHGLSIIFFKLLYPGAKIVGIEADPKIFELLKANIQSFGFDDVTLFNRAVSASLEPVNFYCEGADGGRMHLLANAKNTVQIDTLSLDSIIGERVDFIKIDIEGAETDVVCSSEKLKNADHIFIEYHSFDSTDQSLHKILERLNLWGFRYHIQTQFCSPRPLVETLSHMGMDLQLNIFAKKSRKQDAQ